MPTYQYRCTSCGTELEAVQKFTDDALTDCPECAGNLRKVYNAVGVVFKGSGFYATDNRTKGKTGSARDGEKSAEKFGHKAGEKTGGKSDGKGASDTKPKVKARPASSTGASDAA